MIKKLLFLLLYISLTIALHGKKTTSSIFHIKQNINTTHFENNLIKSIISLKDSTLNLQCKDLALTSDEIALITEQESSQAMTLMNIFEQPDSIILRTPSIKIDIDDPQQMQYIEHLADRMYRTAANIGVGIAAPQVGINRRLILVQRHDLNPNMEQWMVYFNPRITQYSDEFVMRNDGCLSVPQNGEYPEIEGYSYRATWIEVEYWDADREYHKEIITHQFTAHIFQHEIDHLDGIMYFDLQELE